jgi:hypothetical protein
LSTRAAVTGSMLYRMGIDTGYLVPSAKRKAL